MANEIKTVSIIPLNGSNYATWKIQCRMALIKDNLWSLVNETEQAPAIGSETYAKFLIRRDRALAIIVLSVDPSLLYLLGDPEDPVSVWKKLSDQFQKKTWANKLALRRRLNLLTLKEGNSVSNHIKEMTEIFQNLAVIGAPLDEEDQVVTLLASLPECFNTLVTALEANSAVPKMEVVTERLLHEELKIKNRSESCSSLEKEKAMAAKFRPKGPKCHNCKKFGHIKRNCRFLKENKNQDGIKNKVNKAELKNKIDNSDDFVYHALPTNATNDCDKSGIYWIIDSGASCHMCNVKEKFTKYLSLKQPRNVALGDGTIVKATGVGTVLMKMKLAGKSNELCRLNNVLYVPSLTYSLLSVSAVAKSGNDVIFSDTSCKIVNKDLKVIATAVKSGGLYYVDIIKDFEYASIACSQNIDLWHQRYGHLGVQNLKKLVNDNLVDGLDFDAKKDISFCEPCANGKHHREKFPKTSLTKASKPLELVHSDVCGKMNVPSLGGAEYFLTFIDDNTRYVWTYVLQRKDQVFEKFLEWKCYVENLLDSKLKILRTDNGGEYCSDKFNKYLISEGVRHEKTVPKTPEQNGVSERMNRTLVEMIRSMLSNAELPHSFWAEALNTATYLRNRSPSTANNGMTAFESLTGLKPNVDNLRIFGCLAYIHIPKDERRKLDSKASKCVFLGYSNESKAYRLFDVVKKKIIISRDVIFNENQFGLNDHTESSAPKVKANLPVEIVYSNEGEKSDSEDADTLLKRPVRQRKSPDYYGEWVTLASSGIKEPSSVKEAFNCNENEKWKTAMQSEMNSLDKNNVWDLVELPKDRKPIGCKWVFKLKFDSDGQIEKYKARLVAQGFSQQFGVDYDEIFSPVVRHESVRLIIALSVLNGLIIHQMDVSTAFLNGELVEDVYMKQPEGFVVEGKADMVCKLRRSLYGLKQSPRCWNFLLDTKIKSFGFLQIPSDPCIYVSMKDDIFIIAVYVDDILLASKDVNKINDIKVSLSKCFDVKDMGLLHHFLGMKVIQNFVNSSIWIGQPSYIKNVLNKFGMDNSKPNKIPASPSAKLTAVLNDSEPVDQKLYQSAVGSLLYLSIATRPDITYAVSVVSRFSSSPKQCHWSAVKTIFRYLKGTNNLGLLFTDNGSSCVGYSDADWAGDCSDRRSTSGYIFTMGAAAVSWKSKKQSSVALSTAEAEYMALASATQEAVWLNKLNSDLNNVSNKSMTLYEDNQSTMCMAKNPKFHGRTKHIDIKYHFVREQVALGEIELKYCQSENMLADILTKALPNERFSMLRESIGVQDFNCIKSN